MDYISTLTQGASLVFGKAQHRYFYDKHGKDSNSSAHPLIMHIAQARPPEGGEDEATVRELLVYPVRAIRHGIEM